MYIYIYIYVHTCLFMRGPKFMVDIWPELLS